MPTTSQNRTKLKARFKASLLRPLSFLPGQAFAFAIGPVDTVWCEMAGIRCGNASSVLGLMWSIITIALSFVAVVAAGFLVYYGFLYVMSRGEEDNTRRAKAGIAYALIGIVIAGLAAWLVNSVINIWLVNSAIVINI